VPGYTPNLQVVAEPTATGLTVAVATGATLSGVITDNGYPVSGVIVTATDSEGTLTSDASGGTVVTRSRGLSQAPCRFTAYAPDDQYAYVLSPGLILDWADPLRRDDVTVSAPPPAPTTSRCKPAPSHPGRSPSPEAAAHRQEPRS